MFCLADILVYLLGHASWSKERLKGFRKEKGYRLHVDGHVLTVELHSLTHDHIYVRAQCTRETSQSEKAYLTWCLLEKENACIVSAGCECTGDDGACKHVVALLFSIVDWSDRHVDRSTETCRCQNVRCARWLTCRVSGDPLESTDVRCLDKCHIAQAPDVCAVGDPAVYLTGSRKGQPVRCTTNNDCRNGTECVLCTYAQN
ncbi:uncharacterized protein LOC124260081 [Haliotis rubra]|uniref:uncharacterized protein LOC124260081 n=1 Tax=Haliotis rubra TaxID=36100 RepID=UPI001EE5E5FC|nr:uncharacterized protein LOC124260081 [Haliotis rubra]